MPIEYNEQVITPEKAEEILTEHYRRVREGLYRQRNISPANVRRYIIDLRSGKIDLSPDPILFDVNGNLANGQHRLEAVRQSKVSAKFMVSTGWPENVIDRIDRGRTRSIANQMQIHGITNACLTAASVSALIAVPYGGEKPSQLSYSTIMFVYNELDMSKHINAIMSEFTHTKETGGIIGTLAYYHTIKPRKASEFANRIANLELETGTGPQLFVKWKINNRGRDRSRWTARALASAIRLWDEDTSGQLLKPTIAAVDWLASQNKKLSKVLTDMIGARM